MAALCLTMLLPSLGTSIANVALPALADAFDGSFQQVQWVVLAYLLATTTLVVPAGRLGDRIGRRRLLLGGTLLFTGASIWCGFAWDLPLLIAGRAAQGAGAAVLMALATAMAGDAAAKGGTGRAMGLLGTMSAIGTALGPTAGGALIAAFGWPAVFLVNVPLGLFAFLLAKRSLPADARRRAGHQPSFDVAGTVLLALTLGAYALAMTIGRGSFGAANVALLAAAAAGAGWFALVELRAPAPLVRLTMFRARRLSAALTANALVSAVMMATLVVGPFYLARGLGLNALLVGLAMSAGPLSVAAAGVPAGRLADRMGSARMAVAGLVAVGAGCALLSLVPAGFGIAGYVLPLAIVGGGYALFQAANNSAVMSSAAAEERGLVAGLLNLVRNLGLVSGASVMGALFSWAGGSGSVGQADPESVAQATRFTFAVAAGVAAAALAVAAAGRISPPLRRIGTFVQAL
ncbi:MAG TPA: MFS transporter [Allosphingosinicella sp.]|nr:MFS transporter [Allosphingosinicella sp.]